MSFCNFTSSLSYGKTKTWYQTITNTPQTFPEKITPLTKVILTKKNKLQNTSHSPLIGMHQLWCPLLSSTPQTGPLIGFHNKEEGPTFFSRTLQMYNQMQATHREEANC